MGLGTLVSNLGAPGNLDGHHALPDEIGRGVDFGLAALNAFPMIYGKVRNPLMQKWSRFIGLGTLLQTLVPRRCWMVIRHFPTK